jgi:hypothetical protein
MSHRGFAGTTPHEEDGVRAFSAGAAERMHAVVVEGMIPRAGTDPAVTAAVRGRLFPEIGSAHPKFLAGRLLGSWGVTRTIVAVSYMCPPDSSRITGFYPEVIWRCALAWIVSV